MIFQIPNLKLPSLLNVRWSWQKALSVKTKQKKAVKRSLRNTKLPPPPLVVTIIRVGPRRLDDDNLQGACKYVRDQIAELVGTDDGSPLYTWVYQQRSGKYGVEVEISQRGQAPACHT